jgi:hypothetical protein
VPETKSGQANSSKLPVFALKLVLLPVMQLFWVFDFTPDNLNSAAKRRELLSRSRKNVPKPPRNRSFRERVWDAFSHA